MSSDPFFVDRGRLYLAPVLPWFSVSEKSQIQALDRSQPLLPMRPGQAEPQRLQAPRHDPSLRGPRHRHGRDHRFSRVSANSSTSSRRSPADLASTSSWTTTGPTRPRRFAKRPRWQAHFTPTSASRLNQVERWFGLLTDKHQVRRDQGAGAAVQMQSRRCPRRHPARSASEQSKPNTRRKSCELGIGTVHLTLCGTRCWGVVPVVHALLRVALALAERSSVGGSCGPTRVNH